MRDWSFTRRPFWVFTHLFVASWVLVCLVAMMWQIARLEERRDRVEVVEARALGEPRDLASSLDGPPAEADFVRVVGDVTWVDGEVARIGPRSQGGVAGEWVVGAAEMADGRVLLVLRGFVAQQTSVTSPSPSPPSGAVTVWGWLRASENRELLGRVDDGGALAPRVDIAELAARLDPDAEVAPMWLQLDVSEPPATVERIPDPALDHGPHLSYAVQWAVFALLTIGFYAAMLRRRAGGRPERAAPVDIELDGPNDGG